MSLKVLHWIGLLFCVILYGCCSQTPTRATDLDSNNPSLIRSSSDCDSLHQLPMMLGSQNIGTVVSYCGKYLGFLLDYEKDTPAYRVAGMTRHLSNAKHSFFSSGEKMEKREVSEREKELFQSAVLKFQKFWKSKKGAGSWWFPQREGSGQQSMKDTTDDFPTFELIALDPDERMDTFVFRMDWRVEASRGSAPPKKFWQYFPPKGEVRIEQSKDGKSWVWNRIER